METFHEFYGMVETIYRNTLNDIDAMVSVNPLIDCGPEIIIVHDAATVKVENDGFNVHTVIK